MEIFIKLPEDLPYDDLRAVASILEKAHVFVPGYIPPPCGLYEPDGFFVDMDLHGVRTVMLPDRNIVSRLAQLAKGAPVEGQRKLAAAVLAFAQCLEIQIEPSIAFHELAPSQGNTAAHEELSWFRVADNGAPQEWIDAALGRITGINVKPPLVTGPQHDLQKPLRRWRSNYIAVLKIGELELSPLSPMDRALHLMKWMYNDFMLAGPAALFACHYFSPKFPRKRLFKGLRSPERERAIRGAVNAAWDITHLSELTRHINENVDGRTRYLFASFDEGLRTIGQSMIGTVPGAQTASSLANDLAVWWPSNDAERIATALYGYFERKRDSTWWAKYEGQPNIKAEMISYGEGRMRSWVAATGTFN